MFTILSYKLNGIQVHNVHMTFEVKLAFARLLRDSRVTDLGFTSHHNTLIEAQAKQAKLRNNLSQKETV